ncbi:MAG: hypothetical protein WCE21_05640 [Candidatus Babeliales bacterium]
MSKKLFVLCAVIWGVRVDAAEPFKGPETDVKKLKQKYASLLKADNPEKEIDYAVRQRNAMVKGIQYALNEQAITETIATNEPGQVRQEQPTLQQARQARRQIIDLTNEQHELATLRNAITKTQDIQITYPIVHKNQVFDAYIKQIEDLNIQLKSHEISRSQYIKNMKKLGLDQENNPLTVLEEELGRSTSVVQQKSSKEVRLKQLVVKYNQELEELRKQNINPEEYAFILDVQLRDTQQQIQDEESVYSSLTKKTNTDANIHNNVVKTLQLQERLLQEKINEIKELERLMNKFSAPEQKELPESEFQRTPSVPKIQRVPKQESAVSESLEEQKVGKQGAIVSRQSQPTKPVAPTLFNTSVVLVQESINMDPQRFGKILRNTINKTEQGEQLRNYYETVKETNPDITVQQLLVDFIEMAQNIQQTQFTGREQRAVGYNIDEFKRIQTLNTMLLKATKAQMVFKDLLTDAPLFPEKQDVPKEIEELD